MTTTPILSDKTFRLIANLKMTAIGYGGNPKQAEYDEMHAALTELINHIAILEGAA